MIKIHQFTFGPFQENTFLLTDDENNAMVIDPGMSNALEQEEFDRFINENQLRLKRLLLTHGHIDHVMGNAHILAKYGITPEGHEKCNFNIDIAQNAAAMYGIPYDPSPLVKKFLNENDTIKFGGEDLEIRYTPGHAPGHVVFINHSEKWVINGDVLFNRGIGRYDLPGCNVEDLITSILEQMYTLPEDYVVHCGHGPSTTIGEEKAENPFVKGDTKLEDLF